MSDIIREGLIFERLPDHKYGPHSSGTTIEQTMTREEAGARWPHTPLYTQAQVDALVSREVQREVMRESDLWAGRLKHAQYQIAALRAQVDQLMDPVVQAREMCQSPPMIIQGVPQFQVDALVAAERERCANVAVQMDRPHRMYTLACVEIAAAIRSGAVNLPAEDTE